ncbi:MAG TPA: MFS transporter [Gammaproteobacteria bacterium]|nr:MFS transporter [Gammaproteobacteria bacterium]
MDLKPHESLSEHDIQRGLRLIVKDGVAAEVMATLTGGAFLVALAMRMGASNFQIGLMAALPTLANVCQLLAIYLLHRFANRKAITVVCSLCSRLPLPLIGLLPILFPARTGVAMLIALLFVHYFFGSISGTSWSSWMKDLVPKKILGAYFSARTRIVHMTSLPLSLLTALTLDWLRNEHPEQVLVAYLCMFVSGGLAGLYGVRLLARTPEPLMQPMEHRLFALLRQPLMDRNFRRLLVFNASWAFAINLAAPFFTVYMLEMLGQPLSWVIVLSIVSQISNILSIRIWGRYSDTLSNKTVLKTCGPIYLCCIFAWTFTTFPQKHALTLPLLFVIHVFSGITLSGINLALTNIGFKLAPDKQHAVIFLSVKSLCNAFFAGIAPVIGGLYADFFSQRQLNWNIEWISPSGIRTIETLSLQSWDFFFFTAFVLGFFALSRLRRVHEEGEVMKKLSTNELLAELGREANELSTVSGLKTMVYLPFSFFALIRRKIRKKELPAQS